MKIVTYKELKLNLKPLLNSVVDDVEELIIKRKKKKDLVLVSLEVYNSLVETNYLLSEKNREILLKSIQEVKSGKVVYNELIEE